MTYDLSYLTFIATQAALQAGEILRRSFGSHFEITAKPGHQNIVTSCDHASEECIVELIKSHFPLHSILAEERGLIQSNPNEIMWIIDPLDGTTNFARNIPLFAISIAAYQGNEALCGVIFHPINNELFITEKGKGAYLNGKKLAVSSAAHLGEALIGGGFSSTIREDPAPFLGHFSQLTQTGAIARHLGSAALALAYVAAGRLDGFWMDQLSPWDLAAGKLLIEEAGGKVTRYNGEAPQIVCTSNVLSTNQILHQEMLAYLKENR
jgi:myo-inositol-1(or 4)-monophosphatase